MKSIILVLVLLPLIYACSGKDSGNSSGGSAGGRQAQNQKPSTPPPPPPSRKLQFENEWGTTYHAEVTADGNRVVVFPASPTIKLHLDTAMPSASIDFIIEDKSITKGCRSRVKELQASRDLIKRADGDAKLVSIALGMIENERQELRFEAGYFNGETYGTDVPGADLQRAVRAAQDAGFPNVSEAEAATIQDVQINFDDNSLGALTDGKEAMRATYKRLLVSRASSQRLLNGELCELILGAPARATFGGAGASEIKVSVQVEGVD